MNQSVLITTLPPYRGGVPAMARIMAGFLRRRGRDVSIAHYATLSEDRDLVVPSWQMLGTSEPSIRETQCFGDFPCVAVGCRFPELEFTYYLTSPRWQRLLETHDRHIAVGGTVLAANTLVSAGVPHLVWCASTMIEDRLDRRAAMPRARRIYDRFVTGPVQRVMEKRILSGGGRFMALSRYTRDTLIAAGCQPDTIDHVPVPIDLQRFQLPEQPAAAGQLGFAGRVDDPRKNITMLFRAVAVLKERGIPVNLKLTGEPSPSLGELAGSLGIADRVDWSGWLDSDRLSRFYRSLDVFVIPSAQEGLGIVGVEALASGVPVVSTRCGGPEDYVIDGKTGKLAGGTPQELADAIAWVIEDRGRRDELAANAQTLVRNDYGPAAFEDRVARNWQQIWNEDL